jgi:N-acyl-D-amino-acid deacylase
MRQRVPRWRKWSSCSAAVLSLIAAMSFRERRAVALPPDLSSFDTEVASFMKARGIPGGALAVVRRGHLVYAKGYGLADRETNEAVKPDSLFRIASISKPITALAILELVEAKKLALDAPAFELLNLEPVVAAGREPDARLKTITVRQLLEHSGGWDRDRSFDPMFRPKTVADATGVPAPADATAIVRYMLGQRLDHDPGTRFAYSNLGYCVLGRILEAVTASTYEAWVTKNVLAPLGITGMRLGATREQGRAAGEVRYYPANTRPVESVFPDVTEKVSEAYGGFYLEAMDSHGAWLASAVDLARLAAALDDPDHCPILKRKTLEESLALPTAPLWRKADGTPEDHYYGLGWFVRPVRDGKVNVWHTGKLPGTSTLLVRRWDGLSWAVLFNGSSGDRNLPDDAIDPALHRAADAVTVWPEDDLFPRFAGKR